VHCPFEARWWHYGVARRLDPRTYRREIGFGPAWFLHVDWEQTVPDIRVTREVWQRPGAYVGPWPTRRAGQEALEGLWDLFDLCRHPEQVQRAPRGQRCAYAEMGRCDAPCDGAVPVQRYVERCQAAWQFACGGIEPWITAATDRMRAAAAEQRYEHAAQLKQQLGFARRWQRQWARHVHPMDTQCWVLGLPVARRRAWKFFLFRMGELADGPVLQQRHLERDLPPWLRACVAQSPQLPEPLVRTEQTWLWAHLLFNREADAALLERLSATPDAQAVAQRLGERAAALRSAQRAQPNTDDSAGRAEGNGAE
jgi:DNA polymerase-3 subunit epsilon